MLKIPGSSREIKALDFVIYQDFIKSLTEEQLKDEKLIIYKTIEIFYGLKYKEAVKRPWIQLKNMFQIIDNILKTQQPPVLTFKLNDIEYGLLPNFNDITLGELIDCNTEDVFKQMSILYRPIIEKKGNKYLIKEYDGKIEPDLFRNNVTLDIYLGFIGFFLKIQEDLMIYTLKSLKEMDLTPEQKLILERNGDGLVSYMDYVMVI